eukprot:TRINITY_DN1964_c0_g1_i1.p1 TRINITY_DN1964_c0_g1~~TRINITY_DN1964_c0_g1_i1.p1  ORF type:complete len:302 (+),score=73.63 TRINITY_DN1964_c0_g1_i1:154-1059(+)
MEETGVHEITIDKEGPILMFSSKKKWKSKWAILSGGGLYYKAKKKDPETSGPILLKDFTVKMNDEHKKKFGFEIASGGETYIFAFEEEDKRKEWIAAIEEHRGKEVGHSAGSDHGKKKQSTAMRVKKNVGGSVATSSAGKGMIKEFLGKDGVKLLDIVKKVVTLQDGKKKAEEIENTIIRIAVKVILLWKNKDIATQDIAGCVPGVKTIWSDAIDFCEMSFAYDPAKIKEHAEKLQIDFTKLLTEFITDKNLANLREVMSYLVTKDVLDRLFVDDTNDEMKKELNRILRGGWIVVFKDDKQ